MDGLKFKDLVAFALNSYLARSKGKPCPLPIIKGNGKWKMPKITSEFMAELEEEEDLECYRKSFGC